MVYQRRHISIVALAITSALLFSLLTTVTLSAQDVPVQARDVRVIKTAKLGVTKPAGVAFAPEREEFFVLEAFTQGGSGAFAVIDTWDDLVSRQPINRKLDPHHVVYDQATQRLLLLNAQDRQLLVVDWTDAGAPDLSTALSYPLPALDFAQLQGMAIDQTGQTLYFLNNATNELIALAMPNASVTDNAYRTIRLPVARNTDLRGLAIHPQTGHLFTLDRQRRLIYEFSPNGKLVESYSLSESALSNPQSLTFAPSADLTDDPAAMHLFVTDSGTEPVAAEPTTPANQAFSLYLPLVTSDSKQSVRNQSAVGHIVEVSLEPLIVPVHAASVVSSNLVRTVDTSSFPSPDPSGIAYIAPSAHVINTDRFLIVDGEVEEMTIYNGANVFEMAVNGQLLQAYSLFDDPTHPDNFSGEPTGAAFNRFNGHYYITDDDKRSLHVIDPGPDKIFRTADDKRTTLLIRTAPYNGRDAEGVAFGMVNGNTPTLFMADGENNQVVIIKAGPDGIFGINPTTKVNDDIVTSFDSKALGILDPEGIEYNEANNHLYIIGNPVNKVAELTVDGSVVQLIDISAANPKKPAGLAIGPSSQNPAFMNLYIVDRGIDNDKDPNENDGRVFEFTLPTTGNQPPIVNAGVDQAITFPAAATLSATATDDGLGNPSGVVTTTWSTVSGPGSVTFADANALQTTATFTQAGIYVLRLAATDGEHEVVDTVTITVIPANQPPVVNAGPDQPVFLATGATLTGTVSDDGLPNPPGLVTVTWSQVSGPGTVTFANANALQTTAGFSEIGVYVLRLTASDSEFSVEDDVTITVATVNQVPMVDAGADQLIFFPGSATLTGVVSDDGLPNPPGLVTVTWSQVSGPGTVTFANANAANTTAAFGQTGSYTLRLTASDSVLSATDDIVITVEQKNQAPTVDVGADRSSGINEILTLTATVADDGFPNPPAALTLLWEKVSGPGTVTFSHADQANTTATFSTAGVYTLQLTVNDGELSAEDELTVTVTPATMPVNTPPLVNAGNDQIVLLGNSVSLTGTVSDDGLPNPPGQVTVEWQQVSGPETAIFADKSKAQTTATFPVAGSYVLRLTVTDGELSAGDEVTITVNAVNQAPVVTLVASKAVTLSQLSDGFFITATIKDESKPSELTIKWSVISGSGEVTFSNAHTATTTMRVSQEGDYVLQLSVSDGEHTTTQTVTVKVMVDVSGSGDKENFRVFIPLIQR